MRKNYIKIFLICIVIIISLFLKIDDSKADFNYTIGDGGVSAPCDSSICSGTQYVDPKTNERVYGIRFTLLKEKSKKDPTLIRTAYSKDVWRNNTNVSSTSKINSNTIFFEDINSGETYVTSSSGCKDRQSVSYCYVRYLDTLKKQVIEEKNTTVLKNILKLVDPKGNIHNYGAYYLLIEPLVMSYYREYGEVYYEKGTLNENVDWLKGKYSDFVTGGVSNWVVLTNRYEYLKLAHTKAPFTIETSHTTGGGYRDEYDKSIYGKALIDYLDKLQGSITIYKEAVVTQADGTVSKSPAADITFYAYVNGSKAKHCTTDNDGKCTIDGLDLDKTYRVFEYNKGNNDYVWKAAIYSTGTKDASAGSLYSVYTTVKLDSTNPNKSIKVTNPRSCGYRLQQIKNSGSSLSQKKQQIIRLYQYYKYDAPEKEKGDYRKLLDFSADNLSNSKCETVTCDTNPESACLYYKKYPNNGNYSCYSDINYTILNGKHQVNYLCTTKFTLKNVMGFGNASRKEFYALPSRPLGYFDSDRKFHELSGKIGEIELFKDCYLINDNTFIDFNNSNLNLNYINNTYLDSVNFNNVNLDVKLSNIKRQSSSEEDRSTIVEKKDASYIVTNKNSKTSNVDYSTKYIKIGSVEKTVDSPISEADEFKIKTGGGHEYIWFNYDVIIPKTYLELGTGKISTHQSEFSNYRVGNKLYSKYSWRDDTTWGNNSNIKFKIDFKKSVESGEGTPNFKDYETKETDTNKCTYEGGNDSTGGLIYYCKENCNIDAEFREIDIDNPFPKKGATLEDTTRNTMTNWCYDTSRITNLEDITDVTGVQRYLEGLKSSGKELYKDGNINDFDAVSGQYYLADHKVSTCSSDNLLVNYFIKGKTNSYNKKYELNSNKEATIKKTGDGPKYRIRLTPTLMEKVKEISNTRGITYDNFNLDCKDLEGNDCTDTTEYKLFTSKLLTDLKSSNDLTINYSTKR